MRSRHHECIKLREEHVFLQNVCEFLSYENLHLLAKFHAHPQRCMNFVNLTPSTLKAIEKAYK